MMDKVWASDQVEYGTDAERQDKDKVEPTVKSGAQQMELPQES